MRKYKIVLKIVCIVIIAFVICYLAQAFIQMDLNPHTWSINARLFTVISWIIISIVSLIIFALITD